MDRRTLFAGLAASLAAPIATAPASAEAAPAGNIAEAFAAALNAHNIEAFAALFADDYAQHQTSAAARPPTPNATAKQTTKAYFAARLAAFPDLRVTANPVVVAGDWTAANFSYSGTHTESYFGVAPSGRAITFNSCDILQTRDGLIVAHWGAADIAGLLVQLKGAAHAP
jgi:predicted ester cyclase